MTIDFFALEQELIAKGLDSDLDDFQTIKRRMVSREEFDCDEFARQAIYCVLVSGFSQKTAKRIHGEIMQSLHTFVIPAKAGIHCAAGTTRCAAMDPGLRRGDGCVESEHLYERLIKLFKNTNKIKAIVKLWLDRQKYRDDYYKLPDVEARIKYIQTMPHLGKITANHLARNLCENVFKRDVWIERLLAAYGEDLFDRLESETGLPRGYIDVVLWKACQNFGVPPKFS